MSLGEPGLIGSPEQQVVETWRLAVHDQEHHRHILAKVGVAS